MEEYLDREERMSYSDQDNAIEDGAYEWKWEWLRYGRRWNGDHQGLH